MNVVSHPIVAASHGRVKLAERAITGGLSSASSGAAR